MIISYFFISFLSMLRSVSHYKDFDQKLEHWLQTQTFLKFIKVTKDFYLLCFF